MGIPVEEQGRVFQRFFRSSLATEHAIQGTGLGLNIVRAIAEAHHGRLSFESAPGVGTTFRFEVPIASNQPGVPGHGAGGVLRAGHRPAGAPALGDPAGSGDDLAGEDEEARPPRRRPPATLRMFSVRGAPVGSTKWPSPTRPADAGWSWDWRGRRARRWWRRGAHGSARYRARGTTPGRTQSMAPVVLRVQPVPRDGARWLRQEGYQCRAVPGWWPGRSRTAARGGGPASARGR